MAVRAGRVGADYRTEADDLVGAGQALHERFGLALVALQLSAGELADVGGLIHQHEAVAIK